MLDGLKQTHNRADCEERENGFLGKKITDEIAPEIDQKSCVKSNEKSLLVHISKYAAAFGGKNDHISFKNQLVKVVDHPREFCPLISSGEVLFERFKLQNSARKILLNAPHPRGSKNCWQVIFCLRYLLKMAVNVNVMLSKEFKRAHYKNLMTCGSVWTCPCCAARVSVGRGQEITTAGNRHVEAGGAMYMATYTFSHSRQDSLVGLMGSRDARRGLLGALYCFRSSRVYKKLCADYGVIGFIRNLEVTKSFANGWHPHIHELLFFLRELSRDELRIFNNKLFDLWYQACLKSGLSLPNRKHGVDIVYASSPAEYLQKWGREQKWGIDAELTRSHIKRSRDRKGMTPFDLLRLATEKQDYSGYEAKSFIEYATVFYGARQCLWSAGLKQAFGIGEVSDQEIAEREDDKARLITTIDKETWSELLKQSLDHRAEILRLAETGGKSAVDDFLAGWFLGERL